MRVFLCVLYLVLYHQTFGMDLQHLQNIGREPVKAETLFFSTLCKPREALVKVEHEYPELLHRRVFPSCVPLQRCGGCCYDEAMQCVNVSTHTTLIQLKLYAVVSGDPLEDIELLFDEHSQCECRYRGQP